MFSLEHQQYGLSIEAGFLPYLLNPTTQGPCLFLRRLSISSRQWGIRRVVCRSRGRPVEHVGGWSVARYCCSHAGMDRSFRDAWNESTWPIVKVRPSDHSQRMYKVPGLKGVAGKKTVCGEGGNEESRGRWRFEEGAAVETAGNQPV